MRAIFTIIPVVALAILVACNDEEETNAGFVQVSSEVDASIQVALLAEDGGELGAGGKVDDHVINSESGSVPAAIFKVSHTYVPASWGAYDSNIEDRIEVLVEVNDEFSQQVDRVDLTIALGDGSSIDSIVMEQDALDISTYYVFLKPSCSVEERDSYGICQIENPSNCTVEVEGNGGGDGDEGETIDVSGRCDTFTVRLHEAGDSDETETATATPDSLNGAFKEGTRWIPSYSDPTTTLKGI